MVITGVLFEYFRISLFFCFIVTLFGLIGVFFLRNHVVLMLMSVDISFISIIVLFLFSGHFFFLNGLFAGYLSYIYAIGILTAVICETAMGLTLCFILYKSSSGISHLDFYNNLRA